jgi:hypothetical protein
MRAETCSIHSGEQVRPHLAIRTAYAPNPQASFALGGKARIINPFKRIVMTEAASVAL